MSAMRQPHPAEIASATPPLATCKGGNEPYFMSYNCLDSAFERWYCNTTEKNGQYTHIETCCTTEKCNGEIPPLPHTWN
ncbi:Protein RETICULATA-RELATED 4, chloroplastic [Varanus komodoensis]|nr:Protein RETICULATA-RELATED 4, chloroplastic [Varanus komodoensis]